MPTLCGVALQGVPPADVSCLIENSLMIAVRWSYWLLLTPTATVAPDLNESSAGTALQKIRTGTAQSADVRQQGQNRQSRVGRQLLHMSMRLKKRGRKELPLVDQHFN